MNNPPAFYKLLAWEGVGLWAPQRWDIGRYEGDEGKGSFRVDGQDRIMAHVRWWRPRRGFSMRRLAEQFRRNVLMKDRPERGRDLSVMPTDRIRTPEGLADDVEVFVAGPAKGAASPPKEITDVLICARDRKARRAVMWRLLVNDGWPGFNLLANIAKGLILQTLDRRRHWALMELALRSPAGSKLVKSSLACGVSHLRFRWRGGDVGLRRFSAANAALGNLTPSEDDLIRWCKVIYAQDFHDMKYRVQSLEAEPGDTRLELLGRRSWLAPLEIRSFIPNFRRPPRRIEILWRRDANKIYCFEIAKPTEGNREAIEEMIQSVQFVAEMPDDGSAATAALRGPAERTDRQRSLEAVLRQSDEVRTEWNQDQCARLHFETRRPRALRALRTLGALPAGEAVQERTVDLDLVGSMIWRACNGQTRVCDVVEDIREGLQVSYREAEMSVTDYIRTLGGRGLIVLEMPEE